MEIYYMILVKIIQIRKGIVRVAIITTNKIQLHLLNISISKNRRLFNPKMNYWL